MTPGAASILDDQFFHDDDCPYDRLEDSWFTPRHPCPECGYRGLPDDLEAA